MIKLSYRLKTIADFCKNFKRIADVGCDHGKVLGYIIQNFEPEFLIASDISLPSVKKAEKLLQSLNFSNYKICNGFGLNTITESDNLDLIIISGMGGKEIVNILNNTNLKLPTLILQPQNNVQCLREFLNNNNFKIVEDNLIFDKKHFYNILKVKKGKQKLSYLQLKYGVNYNVLTTELKNYLNYQLEKLNNRLVCVENNNIKNEIKENILEIKNILNK